jgi:hypothetical protein
MCLNIEAIYKRLLRQSVMCLSGNRQQFPPAAAIVINDSRKNAADIV